MAEQEKPKGFWQTLPGVLTGVAAIITAIAGLIAALSQEKHPQSLATSQSVITNTTESPSNTKSDLPGSETVINLIGSSNGGKVVVATGKDWTRTIIGSGHYEVLGGHTPEEAVLAFKDNQPATFSSFKVLVSAIRTSNLKEFELLVSNTSPDGPFQSIGKFATKNAMQVDNPYQEFTFQPVKAKYLKIRLLSNHNGYDNPFEVEEFQLLGRLEKK